MKANTVSVEFDGPLNQQYFFQPLGRTIRGRFDSRRMVDAGRLYHEWPQPIPGQTLTINFETGECEIAEPLWDAPHNAIRQKIEAKGMTLPPGKVEAQSEPATLHHWLQPLIETGDCKVIAGKLPEKIEGKPRTRFHSNETADPIDKLTAAITEQNVLMTKLLAKLVDK